MTGYMVERVRQGLGTEPTQNRVEALWVPTAVVQDPGRFQLSRVCVRLELLLEKGLEGDLAGNRDDHEGG